MNAVEEDGAIVYETYLYNRGRKKAKTWTQKEDGRARASSWTEQDTRSEKKSRIPYSDEKGPALLMDELLQKINFYI